jgi:glutathione S-transferase
MTTSPLVVHGTALSGHTHRVTNLLGLLGLPHRLVDSPAPARRTPEFLALNPLGQIPVLQDGDVVLADSNAILVYLARRYAPGSPWLPDEPVAAARVQRWLSIAAGEMKFGPAAARVIKVWRGPGDLAETHALAARLFRFMEDQLATRAFLADDHLTLADVSGYPYTVRAPEGEISLDPYPHIRAWLARLEAVPGWTAMPVAPPQV